jgi:hypothetical protein
MALISGWEVEKHAIKDPLNYGRQVLLENGQVEQSKSDSSSRNFLRVLRPHRRRSLRYFVGTLFQL